MAARILVVDDDADMVMLLEIALRNAGYEVDTAADGEQALAAVAARAPDLVLLDVTLPVLDGWQVLRRLKEDPRTGAIPVVMLTARTSERDLIRGQLEGAVRYIHKPFELDRLLAAVAEALQPPTGAERQAQMRRTRELVARLAELEAGRPVQPPSVRWSGLERPRRPGRLPPSPELQRRFAQLTDRQRTIAEALAAGTPVRELAARLGVSRSHVYATRKRIARRLGVEPAEVAETVRRLLG